MELPDIQNQRDERGIDVDHVGVMGLRYPIHFNDGNTDQTGVATFDVMVALPSERRGTHMSRMVEIVHEYLQEFDPRELPNVLKLAADRLDADGVRIGLSLPLTFPVTAPESGRSAWQACDVTIEGEAEKGVTEVTTTVATDVTSLCPCSKAISDYGAHNQRSLVTLSAIGSGDDVYPLSVSTAFELIRSIGSCAVYPVIKRVDERAITMRSHDHPAFVEDMARDLSRECRSRGVAHEVTIRNFESIHSHDAVATIAWSG